MNQKQAKRLRRAARVAMKDVPLNVVSYERHAVRGNVRVDLTSPRALYHRLKKALP